MLAVTLGVMTAGLDMMMFGMAGMAVGAVGVVRGLVVIAGLMMLGGFTMVLGCVFVMFGLPQQAWERFGIWLVIGVLLYAVYGYGHSRLRSTR